MHARSMCRCIRLNALNVLNAHGPCINTPNLNLLLRWLTSLGLPCHLIGLIKIWLTDRSFYVSISNCYGMEYVFEVIPKYYCKGGKGSFWFVCKSRTQKQGYKIEGVEQTPANRGPVSRFVLVVSAFCSHFSRFHTVDYVSKGKSFLSVT